MQPISGDPFQSQLAASRLPDVQSGAGIRVSGNTIYWPLGGWHEVQYASSFNTVSEGGQSATLDPGVYNVINHTTGERFENILIGQNNNSSTAMLAARQTQSEQLLGQASVSPSQTTTERLSGSNFTNWGPGGIRDHGTEPSATTTVTPESDWPEVIGDAMRDGALAGIGALRAGAPPLVIGEVALGAFAFSVANNVELNTEANPAATTTDSDYEPTGSATSSSHLSAPSGSGMGPDGATTDSEVEPEPTPPSSRPGRNQNSENDSNSHSTSSHSSGGLSSGTGNQTSNNPHTA